MKDYTLYTAPDCHQCDMVENYLKENNIQIPTVFIDIANERADKELFIYPCLKKADEVLAYGIDIIEFLKTR